MRPPEKGVEIFFRFAEPQDARDIAVLFDMANAGKIAEMWTPYAQEGETWVDVAVRQILTPGTSISLSGTLVAVCGNRTVGMLMCRNLSPDPVDFSKSTEDSRSFDELKDQVRGSFYLSIMAVYEEWRGYGVAKKLLDFAISAAYHVGSTTVSAIVHESNTKLLAHYAKRGMAVKSSRPAGKHPAYAPDSQWLLLTCSPPDGFIETETEKSDTDGKRV